MFKNSKKPAYCKQLQELFNNPSIRTKGSSASGKRSVYVVTGSGAWRKAEEMKFTHAFLMLPPGDVPTAYDWSILAGHEPIHVIVEGEASKQELIELAQAMNRDGVSRVYTPHGDGTADCHYTDKGKSEVEGVGNG
jgi:hypothetical protein